MMKSSEEIEREVEATRGELDRTVEALKDRMSAGQIIDEVMGSMKGTGASEMVTNLGRQARENPLPLALVGAGVAWLMFGKPPARKEWRERRSFVADPYTGEIGFEGDASAYDVDDSRYHEDYDPLTGADLASERRGPGLKAKAGQTASKVKSAASSAAHKVADAAHGAASRGSSAMSGARDGLSSAKGRAGQGYQKAGQRLSSAGGRAKAQANQYGQRAQRTFMDTMENEPLIIAAAGVAVGAAIGAALPASRMENRAVGRIRDKALDQGKAMAQQRMGEAKTIAGSALDAAREEADRQGMPTGVETLADKVQEVARAGLDTAKREMEQRRTH
jgi:hypothetical protein